jgi:cytochrome b involved in lipid metabolism
MLDVGGQDATEAFEDVGHSDEAREILEGMLVGNLKRQVRNHTHAHAHKHTQQVTTTVVHLSDSMLAARWKDPEH